MQFSRFQTKTITCGKIILEMAAVIQSDRQNWNFCSKNRTGHASEDRRLKESLRILSEKSCEVNQLDVSLTFTFNSMCKQLYSQQTIPADPILFA
jgi:hypothetical protein